MCAAAKQDWPVFLNYPLDELLRRFSASLRGIQLYSAQHPLVARNIDGLSETVRMGLTHDASLTIGIIGEELVVADTPMPKTSASMGELIRKLRELGVEPKGAVEGLVDFPSLMDGKIVLLCWRLGEAEVLHWHDLETGFAGRQPLTAGSVPGEYGQEDESYND